MKPGNRYIIMYMMLNNSVDLLKDKYKYKGIVIPVF